MVRLLGSHLATALVGLVAGWLGMHLLMRVSAPPPATRSATAGLAVTLLAGAWRYTMIGRMQTSPALGIPMHYVHFTVWLLLALLALFAVLRIAGMLAGTETGAPRDAAEDLS